MKNFLEKNNIKPKYVSYVVGVQELTDIVVKNINKDVNVNIDNEALKIACDEETGQILMYIDDMEDEAIDKIYEYYDISKEEDYVFAEAIISKITGSMNSFAYSLPDYNCNYSVTFPGDEFEIYVPIDEYK